MTDYKGKFEELELLKKQRRLTIEEEFLHDNLYAYLLAIGNNMNHAIYEGGICPDSLDFCKKRNGKVFTLEEIMKWVDDPDKPDIENYDPIIHLGGNKCFKNTGYCNHMFSFISKSLAEQLRPELKANEPKPQEIKININLDPEIKSAIEKKRVELHKIALPNQRNIVDGMINKLLNEVEWDKGLIINNQELTIEQFLEITTQQIILILELTRFKL